MAKAAKSIDEMSDDELNQLIAGRNISPESMTDDELNSAILQKQPKETLESKYLQPLYDVASDISELVEPLAVPGALATRAAVEAYKEPNWLKKPEAAWQGVKAEWKAPGITPESSLTNIFEQYPELKTPQFPQELKMLQSTPEGRALKEQFPKATSVLGMSRAQAMGTFSDVVAQDLALKGVSELGRIGLAQSEPGARYRSLQHIKKLIEDRASSPEEFQKLADTGKIEEMANLAYQDPIMLQKPKDVLDYLQGPIQSGSSMRGTEGIYSRPGGKISNLAKEQKTFIDEISSNPNIDSNVDISQVSAQTKSNLTNKVQHGELDKAESFAEQSLNLRSPRESALKDIASGKTRSEGGISQIIPEKQQIIPPYKQSGGQNIPSTELAGGQSPSGQSASMRFAGAAPHDEITNQRSGQRIISPQQERMSHDVAAGVVRKDKGIAYKYNTAQNYIDDMAKQNRISLSEAEGLKRQLNQKISEAVQDRMVGIPVDKVEDVANIEAKNAIQQHIDDIIRSTIGDKSVPIENDVEMQKYLSKERDISNYINFENVYSKARGVRKDKFGNLVPVGDVDRGIMRNALNAVGDIYHEKMARANRFIFENKPFSSVTMTPEKLTTLPFMVNAMKRGLVENLADYEIPRDTIKILSNKQAVLAKVAQVTDNPQMVQMLDDALNKHPDKLEPVIQAMSTQFPNLFTTDKYNRVDGKIFHPDPMMKQQLIHQAYEAVKNRNNLSNTEKAILWNGLNKDGSLPDSFQ